VNTNANAGYLFLLLFSSSLVLLTLSILKMFRRYKDPERLDALAILAEDNRFMNEADDFHKDFEKSFNIAMRMGKRL
jgi:hypothetical protein